MVDFDSRRKLKTRERVTPPPPPSGSRRNSPNNFNFYFALILGDS